MAAIPAQLIICAAIKIIIVLLTIVVLVLLDPEYTVAYISVNYEIVLIYIISSLTLLYCVVSIIMYAVVQRRRSDTRAPSLTNCSITEVVFAGAGMISWMFVCGVGGTVSQRTIIETGEYFGWLAACAGIIVALFLSIMALFCLNLMTEKIFSPERANKYTPSQYHFGARI